MFLTLWESTQIFSQILTVYHQVKEFLYSDRNSYTKIQFNSDADHLKLVLDSTSLRAWSPVRLLLLQTSAICGVPSLLAFPID